MTVERLRTSLSDRYHVERELGQGGVATVYLAHDRIHTLKSVLGEALRLKRSEGPSAGLGPVKAP